LTGNVCKTVYRPVIHSRVFSTTALGELLYLLVKVNWTSKRSCVHFRYWSS